ncbi:MAG TPA: gluconokinase [Pseudomonadales bacterium]
MTDEPHPRVVVLLGASGAGKSTIGRMLADRLGWPFLEGDDFHSPSNREKMRRGIPLDDADRGPWLDAIRAKIDEVLEAGGSAVVACSALERAYRERLRQDGVTFVYLKADRDVLEQRLAQRRGHFFDPRLLESQLAALEEPTRALTVNAADPPDAVVDHIIVGAASGRE